MGIYLQLDCLPNKPLYRNSGVTSLPKEISGQQRRDYLTAPSTSVPQILADRALSGVLLAISSLASDCPALPRTQSL